MMFEPRDDPEFIAAQKMISAKFKDYRNFLFHGHGPQDTLQVYWDQNTQIEGDAILTFASDYFNWIHRDFTSLARKLRKPWAIVHGDYLVFQEVPLNSEQIQQVRKEGLHLFMHEPLFIYNEDGSWPWNPQISAPHHLEIERLGEWADMHDIKDLHIYLCEQGMAKKLQDSFPQLHLHDWSSYLRQSLLALQSQEFPVSVPEDITKKIISLNFRYQAVRELLVGFLSTTHDLSDMHISFFHSHDERLMRKTLPFDPETLPQWSLIASGLQWLQERLPLSIDMANPEAVSPREQSLPDIGGHNTRGAWAMDEFIRTSFIFAYCESRPFSPASEISEKTLLPMFCKKAFLPFAAPYFLKSLRALGLNTFSEYWDESYDEIEDPAERFSSYLKTLDSLRSKSLFELQVLAREIQPILDHNFEHVNNYLLQDLEKKLFKISGDNHDR